MPNVLATLAILLWPLVSAIFFLRLTAGRALIASIMVGYLFLPPPPTGFDPPLFPMMTKDNIPALVACLLALMLHGKRLRILPRHPLALIMTLIFIFSPMITILNNSEEVLYDRFVLPGLTISEGISVILNQLMLIGPFLIARNVLADTQGLRDLTWAFAAAGMVYALPMLIEIRLSPQINVWVYGFFQHSFDQMMRGDGFRPIVFLYHGLWVALLTVMALLSMATFARHAPKGQRGKPMMMTGFLFGLLVLCKSMAALLYALVLLPLILLFGKRLQLLVALVFALAACAYPILRETPIFPRDQIIEAAISANPDRAQSLEYRWNNEDILMDRAAEKAVFGWGLWGRNLYLDGETGEVESVPDGRWIIIIGMWGWVGFLMEFGLLMLPIWLIWRHARGARLEALPPTALTLCLLLGMNLVDMIPNATLTPLTWLIAGALLGVAEKLAAHEALGEGPATVTAPTPLAKRTVL